MKHDRNLIVFQHDPDNKVANAVLDELYTTLFAKCRSIGTSWKGNVEEHRFQLLED